MLAIAINLMNEEFLISLFNVRYDDDTFTSIRYKTAYEWRNQSEVNYDKMLSLGFYLPLR
jgi:hypothetical protein